MDKSKFQKILGEKAEAFVLKNSKDEVEKQQIRARIASKLDFLLNTYFNGKHRNHRSSAHFKKKFLTKFTEELEAAKRIAMQAKKRKLELLEVEIKKKNYELCALRRQIQVDDDDEDFVLTQEIEFLLDKTSSTQPSQQSESMPSQETE